MNRIVNAGVVVDHAPNNIVIVRQIGKRRVNDIRTITPATILCSVGHRYIDGITGSTPGNLESIWIGTAVGFHGEIDNERIGKWVHKDGIEQASLGKTS
jgi:hypothetical protein